MKKIDLGILFFWLMLSLLTAPVFGKTEKVLMSGDNVWFATKHGLYRYNRVQEEWSIFSTGKGLASDDVRELGIDEGIIWVATAGGVSNTDVRFSDWRVYTANDGLPSNDVRCVAFSEDYVWIGTDQGVARFDKLVEDWKVYTEADGLAGNQINDIASDAETVWFATSSGVSRLDIEFDKWTSYQEADFVNVTQVMVLGEYVWFVTDNGLARYDKRLRSWKSYGLADGIVSLLVNNVVVAGDSIWLATDKGLSTYMSASDSWSAGVIYNTMLPSKNVMDLALDGDVTWFCTDEGVSTYDKKTGSWRHYSVSDGLLDNNCQNIVISGKAMIISENGINLFDKVIQEWEAYEFSRIAGGKPEAGSSNIGFRIDNQGVGFDLSRESQIRLSGFSSLEFTDTSDFHPERSDDYEWNSMNDISLRGAMPGNRSVVGFYNDVKKDNVEYGLTYRGNNTDVLQEATAGEFEAKMRNSEFIEDMNLIGVGARGIYKTRLNVEPRYGKQRGYFETDFLSYRTGTSIYELSHRNVIPDTDEVMVKNEVLQRGVDYLIVYPAGWLVFHREELLEEDVEIEVRYQYEQDDEEAKDNRLAILTAGIDMSDNYYTGLDVLHGDNLDVMSLNGKFENMRMGPVSLKMRPEIAYSRYENSESSHQEEDGLAYRAELIANGPRTQFKADYEGYGEDFWTIGLRESRFGKLDRHIGAFSQVDIARWMPLTIKLQQDRSTDKDKVINSEVELWKSSIKFGQAFSKLEDAKVNLVVSKDPFSIAVTGERNTVSSSNQEESESSARGDFQYVLPKSLLSPIRFRKAEMNGYYKEARGNTIDSRDITRTGYAKLQLSPIDRFAISTSYKINRLQDRKETESYHLREELRRLLVRSDFSTIDGVLSNLYLDDLTLKKRAQVGMTEDMDRAFATSLVLTPGAWTRRLEMLTFSGGYSLIQQTIQIKDETMEQGNGGNEEQGDGKVSEFRSLLLQMNLRPYNTMLWTGTYERMKSWIEDIPPVRDSRNYRAEAELKPGSKARIVLEYLQEHEDEDNSLQQRAYTPSVLWENRWSQSWTTRLRSVYQYQKIRETGEILETGSTLTPSLSFRYTARELPYNGRLYLTQGVSVSVYRAERDARDMASETYSTYLIVEWKITGNLSFRLRTGFSYEDSHTEGREDKGAANIYTRMLARF